MPEPKSKPLTQIKVAGFKSIADEAFINVANLTILAGANSSGKSSIMQPLLLMKQTLEATFDPGPLLLNGPNVKFTKTDQLLSGSVRRKKHAKFHVSLCYGDQEHKVTFIEVTKEQTGREFELEECSWSSDNPRERILLKPEMSNEEIHLIVPSPVRNIFVGQKKGNAKGKINGGTHDRAAWATDNPQWVVRRDKCFFEICVKDTKKSVIEFSIGSPLMRTRFEIERIIHIPGLRGNPERSYPVTAVGQTFPGTFHEYTASIISKWKEEADGKRKLAGLTNDLRELGLTWKVEARRSNAAAVELEVGRLGIPVRGGARDLVNIADVGFGVSQALPILVAIHEAKAEHLVYIEQPEIHLHPRAQIKLAEILANAAERGERIIIETHSSLLLLSVQSLVAEGKLRPEAVALNWFQRDSEGTTHVTQASLDALGRFGEEWPEDFGTVNLEAEKRYLDAVDRK